MPRKKVLVVDDSGTARMLEQAALSRGPYDVITAKDGAEGVAKATAEKPDLILMDVMMPNMGGFDAVRAIRANEAIKGTPVIMVTTRGEPQNVEQGFAAGATDYVTKPVDAVELLAKVRNILGDAR
jgi:DNA-binding response OmpR family regulator